MFAIIILNFGADHAKLLHETLVNLGVHYIWGYDDFFYVHLKIKVEEFMLITIKHGLNAIVLEKPDEWLSSYIEEHKLNYENV